MNFIRPSKSYVWWEQIEENSHHQVSTSLHLSDLETFRQRWVADKKKNRKNYFLKEKCVIMKMQLRSDVELIIIKSRFFFLIFYFRFLFFWFNLKLLDVRHKRHLSTLFPFTKRKSKLRRISCSKSHFSRFITHARFCLWNSFIDISSAKHICTFKHITLNYIKMWFSYDR